MPREATFVCDCGVIAEQSKRGIPRTKCPECQRKAKSAWMANYHKQKKSPEPANVDG